jgi:hypothetical protein
VIEEAGNKERTTLLFNKSHSNIDGLITLFRC